MALINQQVVIFDDGTDAGEASARLAAALGAKVVLVRHEPGSWPGEQLPGPALYETVRLDLSRPLLVDAWLAALPAPIDHLLIGHYAGTQPYAGGVRADSTWPGNTLPWADSLARRSRAAVMQSAALFTGPVLIPANAAGITIPGEVADGYLRGLAKAMQPLRVNAAWTEPVQSLLPAEDSVQARQVLYLSSAPHTRSRSDIGEDVARALLCLINGTALSGSVLRISQALLTPVEAW